MNIPTYLTLARIIMIPIFLLVFFLPFSWSHWGSAIVFFLAGFTDWLDGYLARSWNQTSALGAFLDPVADKLLVCIALVLITGEKSYPLVAMPAAVIVGREVVISALREWMAEIGKRTSVAVSYVGKVKTLLQMFAIFALLWHDPETLSLIGTLGYISLYVAAILTLWSMVMYIRTAWPELYAARNQ